MNISITFSALVFFFCVHNAINATSLNLTKIVDNQTVGTIVDGTPAFYINGKDVCVDENFTIPISVSDFEMITSFQFTIGWDASMMDFDTISFISPTLGSTLLFNDNSSDEGILTISWYDQNVEGLTVDDMTEIFHVKFTAVADNQTSMNVTFEDEPTMKEVSAYIDNNITIVDADFINGAVNIDHQELDTYEIINDVNYSNVGGVNITVKYGTAPFSYMWSNDVESQNLVNVGVGSYMVTVTDSKGCVSTHGEFTIDNTVGTDEILSLKSINLYPNPTEGQFHLNAVFENTEEIELAIFDILGKKVFVDQQTSASLDTDVDISNMNHGTYILQLRTAAGIHTEKFEIIR